MKESRARQRGSPSVPLDRPRPRRYWAIGPTDSHCPNMLLFPASKRKSS